MIYELWDGDSRNLIDAYESEAAALVDVRQLVARNGLDYARSLALLACTDDEEMSLVAEGFALVERANVDASVFAVA